MKKISNFLNLLILSSGIFVSSCKPSVTRSEAERKLGREEYTLAAKDFEELYKTEPKQKKAEVAFTVAECYRKVRNFKTAEKWYAKAEKDKYGAEALKKRAEMLASLELYPEAIIAYDQYLKEVPDDKVAIQRKECASRALKMQTEKTRYEVTNMKKWNTNANDFTPTFNKKESVIFASDRPEGFNKKGEWGSTGLGYSDFWEVPLKKGEPTGTAPALVPGSMNTKWNDGAGVVDAKGTTMYFTQCGGMENSENKQHQYCQLYQSSRKGKEWDIPVKLPFCDSMINYGHVGISADGKTLYFSSDMEGGFGGYDLYTVSISKRKDWGDPVNMGPGINTEYDEMFPFISKAGNFYFSSTGHCGMGGLDIFKAELDPKTGEFKTPENLGSPMNTGADDFGITMDETEEKGYFTSNRKDGRGLDDIYEFHMNPLVFTLTGVVTDCKTGAVLKNAMVTITNDVDSNKWELLTDATGRYRLALTANTSYDVSGDKHEDFYNPSGHFYPTTKFLKKSTELVQDINLCRLDVEGMFEVKGILYDLDKANIRPDAAKILDDSVLTIMKRFPNVVIELGSHTDCRASADYNRDLAQRRADSAVAYLRSRGIDSARMVARGYGEDSLALKKCACDLTDPGNRICSEAEHQLNRRTTIKVLRTDYYTKEELDKRDKKMKEIQDKMDKQKADEKKKEEEGKKTKEQKTAEQKKKEMEDKQKARQEEMKRKQEEKKKEMEQKKKEREEAMKKKKPAPAPKKKD